MNLSTQILFGLSGDWFDQHQAACLVCVLMMIATVDFVLSF